MKFELVFVNKEEAHEVRSFAQQVHAGLHERHGLTQHLELTFSRLSVHQASSLQERQEPAAEFVFVEHADVVGVDGCGLLDVEAGRVGQHVVDVEGFEHFFDREDVAVSGNRPAQQRQVVDEAFGDEPVVAVVEQVRFGVALRQLLVALAHDVGQMAELGGEFSHADVLERFVQHNLAGCRGQQVFTAQHVGDAHECVINGVDERVQRLAVGAHNHEVRNGAGLEGDFAAHHVCKRDVFIRHAHAQNGFAALCSEGGLLLFCQVAVVAVVAQLGVTSGCAVASFGFFRCGERFVQVAGFFELLDDVLVDLAALGLAVGAVGAADVDALIPVQAQPVHGFDDLLVGLF